MKHHVSSQKKTKRPAISANTFTADTQTGNKPVTAQYSVKSTSEKKKDPDISSKSLSRQQDDEKPKADQKQRQQPPQKSLRLSSSSQSTSDTKKATEKSTLGKFALTKDLKPNDIEKLVLLADVDGQERVLKVSPGQGTFIAPNVLASKWIQRIALDGVTAPDMEVLSQQDVQRVVAEHKLHNPKVGAAIEKAIDQVARANKDDEFTAGLMATAAPDSVDKLVAVRLETFAESADPRKEIEELLSKVWPGNNYSTGRANFLRHLDSGDYDKAFGMPFIKSLGDARHQKEGIWRLSFLLTQLGGDNAKLATAQLKKVDLEEAQKYTQFTDWLDGSAGTNAFIHMACADLILGIDDRVVSSFHAGNFSFGDGKLWCIDNAKYGPDLLKGADDKENLKAYMEWGSGSPFQSGSLVEHLRNRILATGLWGLNPQVTIDMVDTELAAVLFRAEYEVSKAAVMDDAPEGADRLKLRVGYLGQLIDDQKKLTDSLRVCEQLIHLVLVHKPSDTHSTKSFGKKLARTFNLWSSSSVEKAHEAKEKLRKTKGLDELKDRIGAAEANLESAKEKKSDQAYAKAQLELEAARFAFSLNEAAEQLKNVKPYTVSAAEKNAIDELCQAWQNSGSDLQGIITGAKQAWDSAVNRDEL